MSTRARRLRGPIAFWALAGVALLISHDAIFLLQFGPGESLTRALRAAGHDYWGLASAVLAVIGLTVAMAAAVRLGRLRREARRLSTERDVRVAIGRRISVAWGRLLAVVAIGFAIQESIEHLAMHGHAIGVGALIGPEYPLALPVLIVISLVAAVIATVVRGAEEALVATIARARLALVRRSPRNLARPPLRLATRRIRVLARSAAGRGPPRQLIGYV
jgi:hypothetical protein